MDTNLKKLAERNYTRGDYDCCEDLLNVLLKENPSDFQARLLLAKTFINTNRLDIADLNLNLIIEYSPSQDGVSQEAKEILQQRELVELAPEKAGDDVDGPLSRFGDTIIADPDIAHKLIDNSEILRFLKPNCVLIFHPGDADSTSLAESLRIFGIDAFPCATFSRKLIEMNRSRYLELDPDRVQEADRLHLARYAIEAFGLTGRIKIIGSYREPIARLVSGFFVAEVFNNGLNIIDRFGELSVSTIHRHIVELLTKLYENRENLHYSSQFLQCGDDDLHAISVNLDSCLAWFDQELTPHIGVDLLDNNDPGAPYIQSGNIFYYKLEAFKSAPEEIENRIGEIIGRPDFRLMDRNMLDKNDYSTILLPHMYDGFKLPGEIVDWIYASRFVQRLYSADEIAGFRDRWCI